MEREAVARLPDSPNLVYLVGLKFGTQQAPWLTWAVNTVVPSLVAERYSEARIVALSTGNVYPYVSATNGGASEELPLAPVGEYGTAALARERIFEYFSRKQGTPTVLLRLNYAVELRYGVLIDIAQKIWAGEAIDVTTGYFNCIWQRDANEMILRSFSLAASPAAVFNLTGPGALSVREIAHQLGTLMGREPKFTSSESSTALVSNASRLCQKLGPPPTSLAPILQWTAAWVQQGGACLGKPTHFEVRSGGY